MKLASNNLSVRDGIFRIEYEPDEFEERRLGNGIFRVRKCSRLCIDAFLRLKYDCLSKEDKRSPKYHEELKYKFTNSE